MIADIQARWYDYDPARGWPAQRFTDLLRAAIDYGHYAIAQEISGAALLAHPDVLELRYLQALAYSRSLTQCVPLLEKLLHADDLPPGLRADTLALEGKLYKNQCQHASGPARQTAAANSARRYAAALELAADNAQRYFLAINTASMSLLAGDEQQCTRYAQLAITACEAATPGNDDYWRLATLGEAGFLLGNMTAAADWYQQARTAAGGHFGSVGSMRAQLQLLSTVRPAAQSLLAEVLTLPRVAAFTGHMIDHPGAAESRFPAAAEPSVAAGIASAIKQHGVRFGYCSAACGGDLLFAEAMLGQDGEVNITLPFSREDFLQTSVLTGGEGWGPRFEQVLSRATSVRLATAEHYHGDTVLFDYTNRLFLGASILRARQMATEPLLIAVLNPAATARTGGTQATVRLWQSLGLPCEIIHIDAHEAGPIAPDQAVDRAPATQAAGAAVSAREVHTMLFADVTGFSRIGEADSPVFVERFLGAAAQLLDSFSPAPVFVNTWGDGIYMVFETLEAGADFALQLRDLVNNTDWAAAGLPAHTGIRIALHCGPVFPAHEPMTKRKNFFGTHVTRAARIEPVTVPGAVYLTEQAAALLVSGGDPRFQCDDLGKIELAKKFGAEQIFRLRRSGEWE